LTIKGDKPNDASEPDGEEDSEADVDEFAADDDETISAELDEFDADEDDEDVDALEKVVALSGKEQDARSLEIRRAIEERLENRRQQQDIDYLDLDFDD
jgi:hypothetical protein